MNSCFDEGNQVNTMSAVQEMTSPLQTLDTNEALAYMDNSGGTMTKEDIQTKHQDDSASRPTLDDEPSASSVVNRKEIDELLMTPPKYTPRCRSHSLDSLLSEAVDSRNDDGDVNRSGIGSVSMLGGYQLSPILRSSEFGLVVEKDEEELEDEGGEIRQVSGTEKFVSPLPRETTDESKLAVIPASEPPPVHKDQEKESLRSTHEEDINVTSTDSFDCSVSMREDDILLAQRQAGASAQAFIQGLRGAAHRRKMNLTRSRDSLAAKEKERKAEAEHIASQKLQQLRENEDHSSMASHSSHGFHARPIPSSTRVGGVAGLPKVNKRPVTTPASPLLGARRASMPARSNMTEKTNRPFRKSSRTGGVAGLPRVEKRPITTPFSPLLGARRKSMMPVAEPKSNQESREHQKEDAETAVFRARTLPKVVINNGGQSGVPKVEKRPTTVPESPLLGPRRRTVVERRHSMSVFGRHSSSTASDTTPVGLAFVTYSENQENLPDCTRQPPQFKEFQLRSTIRAQKRAAFDETRKQLWEARQQEELRLTRERIRRLERELGELRWEL